MNDPKESLRNIQKKIQELAPSRHVDLVVVSKDMTLEKVLYFYKLGIRDFGESRLQDALLKKREAPADIRWHLIGTLQKNKVRKAVGEFFLIHSVDSQELAEKISEISREKRVVTALLLQVNTTGEANKHGFSPKELKASFSKLAALSNLEIRGLMTMGPKEGNNEASRPFFRELRDLSSHLNFASGPILSMGMSSDYEAALQEEANYLRIGTAIYKS